MTARPDHHLNPQGIDIGQFAQANATWAGRTLLSKLERLSLETCWLPGENTVEIGVDWRLSGSTRSLPGSAGAKELWVSLQANAHLSQLCQRCLKPVATALSINRNYRFVSTEAQALELDAQTDEFDVLVSSKRFDFLETLEDELLMALPMSPRHDACPDAAPAPETDPQADPQATLPAKRNPFAALAQLKRSPGAAP